MSRSRRLAVVAALAVAAVVATGAIPRPNRTPHARPDGAVAIPRSGIEHRRPGARVPRRDAVRLARRFAAAYALADAGRPAPRLEPTVTPDLLGVLRRARPRPVAARARPLRLEVVGAAPDGAGHRVALGREGGRGGHVVTVVVVPTPAGPRIAALER